MNDHETTLRSTLARALAAVACVLVCVTPARGATIQLMVAGIEKQIYLPAALATRNANFERRYTDDPEVKCYMPGIPRATYSPYPFQIVQSPKHIMMAYEFASASRTIYMEKVPEAQSDSWMGHSTGRWDGDTLVIDVTGLNEQSWFDRAGDFHSDALHVVERYTPLSRDVLQYEATIEDPKVFSRPWKISMPLYRHVEKGARLMEFRCAQFVEELLYGQYRKTPAGSK